MAFATMTNEAQGIEALHARYKDELFSFLVRLLRDDALAEDALQETFVAAHKSQGALEARSVRAWLFRVARNAAFMLARSGRRHTARVAASDPKRPDSGVFSKLHSKEAIERTRSVLAALPEETRALLLQRLGHGMKLEELAQSFEVTERTIRNRLRAATELFAKEWFARGAA